MTQHIHFLCEIAVNGTNPQYKMCLHKHCVCINRLPTHKRRNLQHGDFLHTKQGTCSMETSYIQNKEQKFTRICSLDVKSVIIYLLYDLSLASSIKGLDNSLGWKWQCQSYVKPFQGGRLQFCWIIKLLKRSLAVLFQSYPLALAEKEQLATASAIFGNYDSTQSATPILVTRNAEPIP